MKRVICKYDTPKEVYLDFLESIKAKLQTIDKKPKGYKKKKTYCHYFGTADFECTNDPQTENAFVYSWAFCFDHKVIVGRTLESFDWFMTMLSSIMGENRLVVFFHNLAYDWCFIHGIYKFAADDCFFTAPRKPLYCIYHGNIELRCSYMLTGLSLANFTAEMGVKHKKLSGEKFDYSLIRTPKDGLKSYQLRYIVNDVLGLYEALLRFIPMDRPTENFYTLPLTKTGYVRRDLREAVKSIGYRTRMSWQLDWNSYIACTEASRGGNTHTSRYYASDDCIVPDVDSNDFASSYPFVMLCSNKFAVRNYTRRTRPIELKDARAFIKSGMCAIYKVRFWDIRLKNKYTPVPYIPVSKCREIGGGKLNEKRLKKAVIPSIDNGRVTKCSYLEITVTDTDLEIILFQYKYRSMQIYESYFAKCDYLPKAVRDVVFKYFKLKTELKGVTNAEKENAEDIYMNAKSKLNAAFGCMLMDPLKQVLLYDDDDLEHPYKTAETGKSRDEKIEIEKGLLTKFNSKGFCPYQWGVTITSIARWNLETMLTILPPLSFIYCDTDSCKYTKCDPSIFDGWNNRIIEQCEKLGYYAFNKKGEKKYLGLFEHEEHYMQFKTLGAKKYCYVDENGKLHLTCAGVNKKKGAKELEDAGGIKHFRNGFVFRKGGGTTAKFNDSDNGFTIIHGYKVHLYKNVYLYPSEYTVGQTDDYLRMIALALKCLNNPLDDTWEIGYD